LNKSPAIVGFFVFISPQIHFGTIIFGVIGRLIKLSVLIALFMLLTLRIISLF